MHTICKTRAADTHVAAVPCARWSPGASRAGALVGDAAGYEDALTGEGISLAVKQAAAAVSAIVDDTPASYEAAWHRITRDYRLVTRGLVLASTPRAARRAIVPLCALLPTAFRYGVNILAY